jgi:LysR family transcriptional activator of nhaA
MANVPVLLPAPHTPTRTLIDQWFERHGLRPRVVGEFEDSALLKTFGGSGMGVFPAADAIRREIADTFGAVRIGACKGVEQRYFAIAAQKRIQHRLVERLLRTRLAAA